MGSFATAVVRHPILLLLCTITLTILMLNANDAQGQTLSTWRIQSNTDIEGISTEPISSSIYRTWFTEYNRSKIGRIINRPAGTAVVSEWKPDSSIEFRPFKIVTGRYNYLVKTFPSLMTIPPYNDFLAADENFKAVPKLIEQSMKLRTFAAFTMPDEGKVGILHQNIYGGPDYFWMWRMADVGLTEPWDIQRRSQSYKETSLWISNQTPRSALYQLLPLANTLNVWNLAACQIDVRVFYVVPGIAGKNTEVWIGGRDTSKGVDYIAYMNIDSKNVLKSFWKWPLSGTRTMTSICFTQKPVIRAGFTTSQVWLVSSTVPEVTILEPKSLYVSSASDYLCESSAVDSIEQKYNGATGVFWPSVLVPSAADNNRRIWIAGGALSSSQGMLAAVKGGGAVKVTKVQGTPAATPVQVIYDTFLALRSDKTLDADSNGVTSSIDTVGCSTTRTFWNSTGGFNPDFVGFKLDVDINGRASADQTVPGGFAFDLIFHEQGSGRIDRLTSGSLAAMMPSAAEIIEAGLPEHFALGQNYPNPFNPATTIQYVLPDDALVTLVVYNSLGQEVRTLVNNEYREVGEQRIVFNSSGLASGVYYYRLIARPIVQEGDETAAGKAAETFIDVKKMILLK